MPQQTLGELFTSVVEGLPSAEDLNTKANTANPVFTGSISLGRKANTVVGSGSIAIGNNAEATGQLAIALGSGTKARGIYSLAIGTNACASSGGAVAIGLYSNASESRSVAIGNYTDARGIDSIAIGTYNALMKNIPDWVANTSYQVNDYVRYYDSTYKCKVANNDAQFTMANWEHLYVNKKQAFVIGNGTGTDARSNALTLDWTGDLHLAGDIYIDANADGTGGSKVATEAFVTTRIPAPPVSDGTYILLCVVSSGVPTYSWVSAGA